MGASTVCLALLVIVMGVRRTETSHDGMKDVVASFYKIVEDCKKELNLTDHVLAGLYHLWRLEYEKLDRNVGCIIICMSKKMEVLDAEGKIHHDNAHQFALDHGAEEEVAKQLVATLHECEHQNEAIQDDCLRVLEVAKCFRSGTRDLNWSPNAEHMIGEVITEI